LRREHKVSLGQIRDAIKLIETEIDPTGDILSSSSGLRR